eukprot:GHVT01055311.1.p1 GENE.GHVT01055311.1~~GHVT01055311.1.p1  ORF type:complete len:243 (+),score=64.00 GHVT01055311.1:189-917(+)
MLVDVRSLSEEEAARLQRLVTGRLRSLLGEEDMSILTEYVWHMLAKEEATVQLMSNELVEFLGDNTDNFLQWLLALFPAALKVGEAVGASVSSFTSAGDSGSSGAGAAPFDRRQPPEHQAQQRSRSPAPSSAEGLGDLPQPSAAGGGGGGGGGGGKGGGSRMFARAATQAVRSAQGSGDKGDWHSKTANSEEVEGSRGGHARDVDQPRRFTNARESPAGAAPHFDPRLLSHQTTQAAIPKRR